MEPRDAAKGLLIRDQPELHVFMLQRNLPSAFAAGAQTFPGGAVDGQDDALGEPGPRAATGRANRFVVAAIRDPFEETGVLLRPVDATARPEAQRARPAGADFATVLADLPAVSTPRRRSWA